MESRFQRRYVNLREPVWGKVRDTGMDHRTRDSGESEFSRTLYTNVKSHDETHYFVQKNVCNFVILKIIDNGKLLDFVSQLFMYFKVLHSD